MPFSGYMFYTCVPLGISINFTLHVSKMFVINLVAINSNIDLLFLPLFSSFLNTPKVHITLVGNHQCNIWLEMLPRLLSDLPKEVCRILSLLTF